MAEGVSEDFSLFNEAGNTLEIPVSVLEVIHEEPERECLNSSKENLTKGSSVPPEEETADSNVHMLHNLETVMMENAQLMDKIKTLKEKKKRIEIEMKEWKQEYEKTKNQNDILESRKSSLRIELQAVKDELSYVKQTYSEEMSNLFAEKGKAEAAYNQTYRENLLLRPYTIQLKVQLDICKDKLKECGLCDIDYSLPLIGLTEYEDGYQELRRATSEPWIEFPPMELNPHDDFNTLTSINMSPKSGSNIYSPLNSPFRRWYRYQGRDHENTPPLRSIQQEIRDLDQDYGNLALPDELAMLTEILSLDGYDEAMEESDQNFMLHILCRIVENAIDSEYHISDLEYAATPIDTIAEDQETCKSQKKNNRWLQWAQVYLAQNPPKKVMHIPDLVVYGEKKKIFTSPETEEMPASAFEVVKVGSRAKAYYPNVGSLSQQASGDCGTCSKHKTNHSKPNWMLRKLKIRKVIPHA